jgi:hypothetical protein
MTVCYCLRYSRHRPMMIIFVSNICIMIFTSSSLAIYTMVMRTAKLYLRIHEHFWKAKGRNGESNILASISRHVVRFSNLKQNTSGKCYNCELCGNTDTLLALMDIMWYFCRYFGDEVSQWILIMDCNVRVPKEVCNYCIRSLKYHSWDRILNFWVSA